MLENIDKIIEFVTMLSTVLFVICRSNANVKKKIDEHLKPNGGSSVRDALDRIEKKLSTVEATQRALLELQGDSTGHFLATKDGDFFWVSDKFAEILGTRREECLKLEWFKGIPTEEHGRIFNFWQMHLKQGGSSSVDFSSLSGKNIRLRSVSIVDERGLILGFVGNIEALS